MSPHFESSLRALSGKYAVGEILAAAAVSAAQALGTSLSAASETAILAFALGVKADLLCAAVACQDAICRIRMATEVSDAKDLLAHDAWCPP